MRKPSPANIEIRIRDVRQLFNSIDPSPFRERDLDPDCEEFIVSWARELPPDRPIRIAVHVEREVLTETVAGQVEPAVHAHFEREAALQSLRLHRSIREGRLSLGIGLVVLALCIGGATLVPSAGFGTLGDVFAESLIIAGWVVMWHPLEVLLYGLWPVRRERRLLERLAAAEVTLTGPSAAPASA